MSALLFLAAACLTYSLVRAWARQRMFNEGLRRLDDQVRLDRAVREEIAARHHREYDDG